jgi:ATP-dependent Lhr-like helicase
VRAAARGWPPVTNAGVIPDQFDYDVVLQPEGHRVGTLNEDFAFESLPGDVFQLGNSSYRIRKVETGKVLVEDAHGQPPTMPFWLGESLGPHRRAVPRGVAPGGAGRRAPRGRPRGPRAMAARAAALPAAAAQQLALYLATSKAALGVLPTERRIVFERFFDEVGDTHLVIHSPHGSRINKAWGLALRKRMCRKFNFELQASALEDSIVLSLGPTHSFPLDELRHYLKAATARDLLVQALLDAPMFGTRWRWNATASLAVRRMNGGRKVPPQFQRADAEDLLTVVFPDQQACAENLVGEREIPEHPLVAQTLHDCLHDTMDVDGFVRLLERIESGEIEIVTRDLATPSPLSHAILNARPYAFLDDGAAEERRTRAVATKALMDMQTAHDIGRLDAQAIAQVRADAWPAIGSPDELHDALCVHGFLTDDELPDTARPFVAPLQEAGARRGSRSVAACTWRPSGCTSSSRCSPRGDGAAAAAAAPARGRPRRRAARGPAWPARTARPGHGRRARGAARPRRGCGAHRPGPARRRRQRDARRFTAPDSEEWCDRRLLARMHRMTRDKLRADFQPVPPAQFMRFLFRWHQLAGADGEADERREGRSRPGRRAAPARGPRGARRGLGRRPAGRARARLRAGDARPAVRGRPHRVVAAVAGAGHAAQRADPRDADRAVRARRAAALAAGRRRAAGRSAAVGQGPGVQQALREHGASFFADLQRDVGLLGEETEQALAELVAQGLVTCDTFAGLRALVMPAERRNRIRRRRPGHDPIEDAGRWSLTRRVRAPADVPGALAAPHVEHIARVLLRRWGVVFRKLIEREDGLPTWRELHYVYRRLEARGELRGGRFVSGFSGEQFALPEAAAALRKVAKTEGRERVSISAADPLNLAGILTPGEKIARLPGNRLLFEGGVPIAVHSGGEVRYLATLDASAQWEARKMLIRKLHPGTYLEPPAVAQ